MQIPVVSRDGGFVSLNNLRSCVCVNVDRSVFQRYVEAHPHSRAFLKWARWEDKQSQYALAR